MFSNNGRRSRRKGDAHCVFHTLGRIRYIEIVRAPLSWPSLRQRCKSVPEVRSVPLVQFLAEGTGGCKTICIISSRNKRDIVLLSENSFCANALGAFAVPLFPLPILHGENQAFE